MTDSTRLAEALRKLADRADSVAQTVNTSMMDDEIAEARRLLAAHDAQRAESTAQAPVAIGFRSRIKGSRDGWMYIYHRDPDSFELRECEIETVWAGNSAPAAQRAESGAGVRYADALMLAQRFHESYERLAPSFGYATKPETRAFNPESENGRLMIAVCKEILAAAPGKDHE